MPKVAWATLDFSRSALLPSLAGGMEISTSVPSGTGNGSLKYHLPLDVSCIFHRDVSSFVIFGT